MFAAVLLPVLVGLDLQAMGRLEGPVSVPHGHDAGGEQGPVTADRTGAAAGRAAADSGDAPGDRTLTWGQGPRPHPSRVKALQPAASPPGPTVADVHGARHSSDEAAIDPQDPGRPIEGRGPWTQR